MLEKIYAFVLSLQTNIVTQEEYADFLNMLFLEEPTNEWLVELEFASNNLFETLTITNEALYRRKIPLNYNVFGYVLFENIRKLYEKRTLGIEEFGLRAYTVWNLLPGEIKQAEPFWTLSYADDCLSYVGETQARELYEGTFSYKWNT